MSRRLSPVTFVSGVGGPASSVFSSYFLWFLFFVVHVMGNPPLLGDSTGACDFVNQSSTNAPLIHHGRMNENPKSVSKVSQWGCIHSNMYTRVYCAVRYCVIGLNRVAQHTTQLIQSV